MKLAKPVPTPTPTSQPYWDALNKDKVALQRCDECKIWIHYPRSHCPGCLSEKISWHEVSGNGVIYTYTLTRQPTAPHFADDVPQKLAVVELEQGVRVTTTLVNIDEAEIRIGMRVRPYFDHVSENIALLLYQPA